MSLTRASTGPASRLCCWRPSSLRFSATGDGQRLDRATVASDSRVHVERYFATGGSRMNTSLPWRFTFTSDDRDRLESLAKHMTEEGYHIDGEILNEDRDSPLLVLEMERNELHSIDSLHNRWMELTELARQYGAKLDSWGVARLPPKRRHWWEFWK